MFIPTYVSDGHIFKVPDDVIVVLDIHAFPFSFSRVHSQLDVVIIISIVICACFRCRIRVLFFSIVFNTVLIAFFIGYSIYTCVEKIVKGAIPKFEFAQNL